MDGPRDCQLSTISLTEEEKLILLINKTFKNGTNGLIYKTEADLLTYRMNLWLLGRKVQWGGREGIVREFGMDMYTLLYLK